MKLEITNPILKRLLHRNGDLPIPRFLSWPFALGNRLEVSRHSIPIAGLPEALEGFRIVHLTDFHAGEFPYRRRLRANIRAANDLKPDMIAVTGDYMGCTNEYDRESAQIIGGLEARLGVFAVRGNHDIWPLFADEMMNDFKAAGFRVLINEHEIVEVGAARLCVMGVDDSDMDRADLDVAAAGTGDTDARVLLSHSPDIALSLNGHAPDLVLTGHTHGGQINLPFWGPITYFSHYVGQHGHGLTRLNGSHIFNNRGVGTSFLPIRFRCRPEIAVLTLTRAAK